MTEWVHPLSSKQLMLMNRPSSRVVICPFVDTSFFHILSTWASMMHVSVCRFSNGSNFWVNVPLFLPMIVFRTNSGLRGKSMLTLPFPENPVLLLLLLLFLLLGSSCDIIFWV